MRPRVWITGAAGLIGGELLRSAPAAVEAVAVVRGDVDLTDAAAVRRRHASDAPAVVVHCAGLTRSPACQQDPATAWRLNRDVVRTLVALCPPGSLLSFSTDLVFDGRKGGYVESDAPNPLSVYAETKVAGEQEVLGGKGHVVVRTSLNYGFSAAGDRSFNEEMVAAARKGGRFRLFTDEFRCPIPAVVTARAVWDLVGSMLAHPVGSPSRPKGIYHLAGAERLSRWEIGNVLSEAHPELQGRLDPGSLKDYQGAPRPADTSMCCDRIAPFLSETLPGFSDWLRARRAKAG